jgi:lipid II:glycine glycyltransferase (peptidoglycan interpeptide bridge formation enzyme)
MPSYAVQWQAMQEAAELGCRDYDLWGLPPAPDPTHPWFGLWQFKTGFGGDPVEYTGAWDLVLSPVRHRAGQALDRGRRPLRILKTIRNIRLQGLHS